jgi:hypothetical protein
MMFGMNPFNPCFMGAGLPFYGGMMGGLDFMCGPSMMFGMGGMGYGFNPMGSMMGGMYGSSLGSGLGSLLGGGAGYMLGGWGGGMAGSMIGSAIGGLAGLVLGSGMGGHGCGWYF